MSTLFAIIVVACADIGLELSLVINMLDTRIGLLRELATKARWFALEPVAGAVERAQSDVLSMRDGIPDLISQIMKGGASAELLLRLVSTLGEMHKGLAASQRNLERLALREMEMLDEAFDDGAPLAAHRAHLEACSSRLLAQVERLKRLHAQAAATAHVEAADAGREGSEAIAAAEVVARATELPTAPLPAA